jgi:hypothetical protein
MKSLRTIVLSLSLASLLLSACGSLGGGASPTPDICGPANIKNAARAVNALMLQFDDQSALAANVQQTDLAPYISALQTIRRAAEQQSVPPCLQKLKQLQLAHMNTVINTMLGFLGGGDQNSVAQGIGYARQQHDQYMLELARLLDVTPTIVTPPTSAPATATPAQSETPASTTTPSAGSGTATNQMLAVNPGPYPINLREQPSVSSRLVTTLDVGSSAVALGIQNNSEGQWFLVQVPGHTGKTAFVSAADVRLVNGTPSP